MANTKSAAKRARQTKTRTNQNRKSITQVKSQVKKLRTAIGAGDKAEAKKSFSVSASSLDKAAKQGRIHKNAANRQKSRLNKALAALK